MKIEFYKTGELNGSSYVIIPLRSNALLNIKNDDKFYFTWSRLASLLPGVNDHPNRVSNYRQYFDELIIEGFDFSNEFKCSYDHKFEKLNNSSINIFELNCYQNKNKWKPNSIPFEISEKDSNRVIDLLIYKNHYALNKKLNVFLGDYHEVFICRRCLNSYTIENILIKLEPRCEIIDITTIKISPDSHISWKKHFQRNPLFF